MERYHDPETDPSPLYSPAREVKRRLIAALTRSYLDKGGKIEEVGYQMSDEPQSFVINAQRSPVYAHLFTPPQTLH